MKGKVGSVVQDHFVLNTGAKIPAIGLGTWHSGGDLCVAAVKTALSVGYRHIDCAHLYGNEVEVGEALSQAFSQGLVNREEVFLTSKLYCTMNSLNKIENYVSVSLKNLGVSYLDLYLMHWPESSAFRDATDPPSKSGSEYRQFVNQLKKAWKTMEGLVEVGVVKAIGVSNFSVPLIKVLLKFAKVVPAVNQVELHPFWRQEEIVKFCQLVFMYRHTCLWECQLQPLVRLIAVQVEKMSLGLLEYRLGGQDLSMDRCSSCRMLQRSQIDTRKHRNSVRELRGLSLAYLRSRIPRAHQRRPRTARPVTARPSSSLIMLVVDFIF